MFPLGRLRESPEALARASVIVLSRAEPGRTYEGLIAFVRRINARAPIVQSRITPIAWADAATGAEREPQSMRGRRIAAFCGLGNPASFWRTIAELRPVFQTAFEDHHRYVANEIEALAHRARGAGCEALVTTEKDFYNLPRGDWPLPVHWLRVECEVDGLEELLPIMVRD